MTTLTLLDPSIGSRNLGDSIISDAIQREIRQALPEAWLEVYSSHQSLGLKVAGASRRSAVTLVGGSNLLDASMGWFASFNQWGVGIGSAAILRGSGLALVGVGAKGYVSRASSRAARSLLPRILDRVQLHSVRDHHTLELLRSMEFTNVLYTACPTMWNLTGATLERVPTGQGADAVIALTDYAKSPDADRAWVRCVLDRYEQVWLWPQGHADLRYFAFLGVKGAEILHPTLPAFDQLLSERPGIDYVGTRLHAGIRALQHGRRAVVMSVDNRARELAASTGLPVVEREAGVAALVAVLDEIKFDRIDLPNRAIESWRVWLSELGAAAPTTMEIS